MMVALIALAGSGAAAQHGAPANVTTSAVAPPPPIAVTNSPPPPIVAVPNLPGTPGAVFPSVPFPKLIPAPPRTLIRGPEARSVLQDLVRPGDYPASAVAMRAEGRVWFALTIGANGRVADCAVIESSGSPALDFATCRLMRARGRFTPAIDNTGMPAVGIIEDAVEWRLPN